MWTFRFALSNMDSRGARMEPATPALEPLTILGVPAGQATPLSPRSIAAIVTADPTPSRPSRRRMFGSVRQMQHVWLIAPVRGEWPRTLSEQASRGVQCSLCEFLHDRALIPGVVLGLPHMR